MKVAQIFGHFWGYSETHPGQRLEKSGTFILPSGHTGSAKNYLKCYSGTCLRLLPKI